ncbi:MAG TPA: hypothetical protein VGJ44_23225 [Kribbellaceae bacterium]
MKDLPSGWSVDTSNEQDDSKLTSTDPKCAAFLRYSNTDTAPGSKAMASRSFSGGQNGPYIDESFDWMGSVPASSALIKSFAASARSCHKAVVKVPGQPSSAIAIAEVSAPKFGTSPFAVRMTGTGGPFQGVEIVVVVTGIEDVVLSMTFVGATPEDVDGATDDAATKAQRVLGGTTGS